MTARLHCFGESGNCYKAALTLELAGYPWEPVWLDFFHGGARRPEFLALNEMGEAPVFVEDGTVLTQSCVIQLHVAESTGSFLPPPELRPDMLRWMFWDGQKGSGQQGALRFLMNFLPADRRLPAAETWLANRVGAALGTLERHLAGREWMVGEAPSLADLACCGYLFYPEPFGFDRKALPAIDAWLDRIAALPGWKPPYALMPGNPADRA